MTQENFQQELLSAAKQKGFSEAEVYIAGGRTMEVRVFAGEISHYENSLQRGICFRGLKDGNMGYAFSEKLDESVIPWLLDEAAANSVVISEKEKEDLFPGESWQPSLSFSPELAAVEPQVLIEATKMLESSAFAVDAQIKSVEYALTEYVESEILIANTLGLQAADKSNLLLSMAVARAVAGKSNKQGIEVWQGRDINSFRPDEIGRGAAEDAISHLGATSVESGRKTIVLERKAACDLLSSFLPIFYGDMIQQGFSLLGDKLNQEIASPLVHILDDPRCGQSFYKPAFDSEGVATRRTELISQGKLQNFLHSRKTAARAGTDSTGNGFKPSWKAGVGVAATNGLIVPGEMDKKQLLQAAGQGLIITRLTGLHAGTNLVSGDFSLSAEGFTIENGLQGRPVEQITVAGNFYQLLRDVKAVGNDLFFALPHGSGQTASPSLLLDSLSVSGQ